ncbi:hypothetical protein RR48_12041 [Papilio machaon]|uniref:Uncharacterized protein n=1 Tax=Papilio machaon TaxID=76193 RepID=A0A194RK34_PAPMA|nr:hypothetical protein RR48_12041 [Papilio machaon]
MTAQYRPRVTYEAKVIEVSSEGLLRVHYTGWNTRYDEWIKPQRIALNVTQHDARNKKNTSLSRRSRSKRTEETSFTESSARSDSDTDSDSDDDIKRACKKPDDKPSLKTPPRSKDAKSSDSSGSSKPRKRPVRTISTPTMASPAKKPRVNVSNHQHQGRDYDLNEIRSELKGLHSVKQEPEDTIKPDPQKDKTPSPVTQITVQPPEPPQPEKQAEDVYEFKEPEPFEIELHDEKKKRMHRIFDDISPSKYTSTLSKSLSEEISEDSLRPRASTLRSPSLSPFRDFAATREEPNRQTPEEDSKDGLFSIDDDSLPGEGSSGPIFEGFTPAKNQETYSKKNKVNKLRELIDDSPDSPADDERSSEDEPEEMKEESEPSSEPPLLEIVEVPEPIKEEIHALDTVKEVVIILQENEQQINAIPQPPRTPPLQIKLQAPDATDIVNSKAPTTSTESVEETKHIPSVDKEEQIKLLSIPLPTSEPKEKGNMKLKIEKLDPDPIVSKLEPPSSPLIDTEEDKSEPDSPARIDVLPEPPPGFLLQSEGPKIAEKLLKAINSAKRLSMSPPPVNNTDRPLTPIKDIPMPKEDKLSSISPEIKPLIKSEPLKPLSKIEPIKKISPLPLSDSIFGEPSNFTDLKRDLSEIKKIKSKEPTPPRLQSPLNILERRKSVADLSLSAPGKNNKVLSDTIQKLSSQINQSAASIPLPPFPPGDRSETSDSDDSDRRLIIDKVSMEEWGSGGSGGSGGSLEGRGARALHAGKSLGEWSAGESLLMLEDACKNERKHSASVVVAGSGRAGASSGGAVGGGASGVGVAGGGEDDSNISLLLCEETIPGSPAPDAEPAPPRHKHTLPFACAPPHHSHSKASRSRKASESSTAGRGRSRRARRDTDEHAHAHAHAHLPLSHNAHHTPYKYNFILDLDPTWDCEKRIKVLTSRLGELRKTYHSVKAELAAIDRRRKKLRRKEREAVKAAKAACS